MIDTCKKCGAKPQATGALQFGPVNETKPLVMQFCTGGDDCLDRANKPKGEHLDVKCTVCGWLGSTPCLDAKGAE